MAFLYQHVDAFVRNIGAHRHIKSVRAHATCVISLRGRREWKRYSHRFARVNSTSYGGGSHACTRRCDCVINRIRHSRVAAEATCGPHAGVFVADEDDTSAIRTHTCAARSSSTLNRRGQTSAGVHRTTTLSWAASEINGDAAVELYTVRFFSDRTGLIHFNRFLGWTGPIKKKLSQTGLDRTNKNKIKPDWTRPFHFYRIRKYVFWYRTFQNLLLFLIISFTSK